mmetsp:Transcript_23288/g.43243  ORF Transcript_23288/g.43243 Transcript_23288/m.43243 type:complete len:245 (+) Transcript_23288:151-885(+)
MLCSDPYTCCNNNANNNDNPATNIMGQLPPTSNISVPTAAESEKMVADAMAKLSVEERNSTLYDLHGIRDSRRDDSEDLPTKLKEMGEWMEVYSSTSFAYQLAKTQNEAYVTNPEFCSIFLKSTESGKPYEAARKMLSFFDHKLELFGKDALCRQITISDLDEDDLECLEFGFIQYIGKDSVGRTMTGIFPSQFKYKTARFFSQNDVLLHAIYRSRTRPSRPGLHFSILRKWIATETTARVFSK